MYHLFDVCLNKSVLRNNVLVMQLSHCRINSTVFFGNLTSLLHTHLIWLSKRNFSLCAHPQHNPSRLCYAVSILLAQSIFTLVDEKSQLCNFLQSVQRSSINWANLIQSNFILCDNCIQLNGLQSEIPKILTQYTE